MKVLRAQLNTSRNYTHSLRLIEIVVRMSAECILINS